MGWAGTKNGALLQLAAAAGFAVLITKDSGVSYQQNLQALPLSIMVLSAATNDIDDIVPLIPLVLDALNHMTPCSTVRIP